MPQTAANVTTFNNYAIDKFTVAIHFPQGCRKVDKKTGKSSVSGVTFDIKIRFGSGSWQNLKQTGGSLDDPYISVGYDAPIIDGFTYTRTYDSSLGHFDNSSFPISVQIQRVTATLTGQQQEESSFAHYTTSILHTVTATRNTKAVTDPKNVALAKTALSIQATKQLSGQIEGINAVVQTYCWDWDQPTNAWILRNTNNPASLFLYVLTHPANPQRIVGGTITEPYLVNPVDISSKVDLTKLKYWHNFCNTARTYTDSSTSPSTVYNYKYTFNSVMGSQRSVLEVLRDICAAGRASPALIDGVWSVNIDEQKTNPIQHFTPHNSWGFEGTKALPKTPHALKIKIYDEDSDYQENELIVYNTGYAEYDNLPTKKGAELFESITLPGVTSRGHAIDLAKWHFAQIKLRPEIYTLNTDIEYLVCNRGDWVKVTHDVPMWGLGSGRIKNRISSTVFDLDEMVNIDTTKNYTLRIRGSDGSSNDRQVKKTFNVTGYSYVGATVTLTLDSSDHPLQVGNVVAVNILTILNTAGASITNVTGNTVRYTKPGLFGNGSATLAGTITLATDTYSRLQVIPTGTALTTTLANNLDLFMFGELGKESQDLVILSIEPASSKTARLTMVDYGVVSGSYNIFTDYLTLTENAVFETNISSESFNNYNSIGILEPLITLSTVRSDDGVAELDSTGVYTFGIRVPYTNPLNLPTNITLVEGELVRMTSASGAGSRLWSEPIEKGSLTFKGVQQGAKYKFRLRYVTEDGRNGVWTDWYSHQVVGKVLPPENVTDFEHKVTEAGLLFTWKKIDNPSYSYTVIKQGPSWSDLTSEVLFSGNADSWLWTRPLSGLYDVFIKHYTIYGTESVTATSILGIDYYSVDLGGIIVSLTNDTHQVPSEPDGTNPLFTGSGTNIYVYEYGNPLSYSNTPTAPGTWKISTKVDSGVTSGTISIASGNGYAVLSDLTGFADNYRGKVTLTITGTSTSGDSFTITGIQNLTKLRNGAAAVKSIVTSTPVVYKDSPDSTTAGTFSAISVSGNKTTTTGTTTYGWLGVQPYVGGTAGTELFAFRSFTATPSSSDQTTKWIVRLYDYDSTTYNNSSISQPPSGTAVVDTEEVQVAFKGATGAQGLQGATGAAGAAGAQGPQGPTGDTLYTWIAYANNATGTSGFTTGAWTNQTYIGISNNNTSSTEGTNPAAYTWSLIKGDQGVPGTPGANGVTTYTWFAYANNSTGTSGFTTGSWTNQTYLGIATNKTTDTESQNPADYFWSKIEGPQGATGAQGPQGATGAQGPQGSSGTKSITITAFKWSNSGAGSYSQSFTYTWSGGNVDAYPSGWSSSAGAAPSGGYVLYQINLIITDSASATTTNTNWSSATLNTIGYRQDGSIGAQGDSYRIAYFKSTSATPPGSPGTTTGSSSVPSGWSASPMSLVDGEFMYQSDGVYVVGTNTITWSAGYLSNLKVGNLSAISASLGVVGIASGGSLASTGKTYGSATAGFFLGWDSSAYKFDIGNSTNYLRWDGSILNIAGTIALTSSSTIDGASASTVKSGAQSGASSLQPGGAAADVNANVTTISGAKITTGSIEANRLSVTNLSSINSNLGTINAGSITIGNPVISGTTITGSGATILSNGNFAAGNSTTNITFNGTVLTLNGNIVTSSNITPNTLNGDRITDGTIVGAKVRTGIIESTGYSYTTGNFSTNGTQINLDNGLIRSKNFSIDASGNAFFKGDITGASGTFSGQLQVGGTAYNTSSFLNSNTTATDVGLGNVSNLTPQNQAQTGIIAGVTIASGGITMNTAASIKAGQTSYNNGTGFFLGFEAGVAKFSIGNSTGNRMFWDTTSGVLTIIGTLDGSALIGTTPASTVVTNSNAVTTKLDRQTTYILGSDTATNKFALITDGFNQANPNAPTNNGIAITSTGIIGKQAGVTTFAIDNTGNATFVGTVTATAGSFGGVTIASNKVYSGTGTFNNANTAFYFDNAGQFSLKDRLTWNGTDLTIRGNIDTNGTARFTGSNASFSIDAALYASATGGVTVGIRAEGPYGVWGTGSLTGAGGVWGTTSSSTGYGVLGTSTNSVNSAGVRGSATGNGIGVDAASSSYIALRTTGTGTATALYVEGPMQVTTTSLVTNLNADMVDGRHVGTGTNQIPINNDTVNPGLVAGYLGFGPNKYYLSGTAATGAATATYSGVKPGNATTNSWLSVHINGTQYYVPIWPA